MKKKKKQHYEIKNWPDYNQALINRGSLTLWIDESMIQFWHQPEKTGYRDSPMTYSDMAIQCALHTQPTPTNPEIRLPHPGSRAPRHLVIDSTGLKVYGEDEWKVRLPKHLALKNKALTKYTMTFV